MDKQINVESVITSAIQMPGIKVNREDFLKKEFIKEMPETLHQIIEIGPVEAGIDRKALKAKAVKIISNRTVFSSGASFISGLPGGLGMAVALPADMLQYYAVALRLAQEIAYLYGEEDLFRDGGVDEEHIQDRLILYLGVMLGATGASQGVKVIASAVGKQLAKKLPQKTLTKGFVFPLVKNIAKVLGKQMTKEIFGKAVGKAIPVIGGVVSGGITAATLPPMAKKLLNAFDEAKFNYSVKDYERDVEELKTIIDTDVIENVDSTVQSNNVTFNNINASLETIKEAKQMLDDGIITDEEFARIKEMALKAE